MDKKWSKLELENNLFYWAQKENIPLHFRNGCLHVSQKNSSALVHHLARIYNRFFATENRLFLKDEIKMQRREYMASALLEEKDCQKYPVKKAFHLSGTKQSSVFSKINGKEKWC